MMARISWDDLQVVQAVFEAGTLSGAAIRLASSPATIGRRVAAIEAAMNVVLFARGAGGYLPTAAGTALARRLTPVAEALSGLEREAAALSGHVRLATADTLAVYLVAPALAELAARRPEITVELLASALRLDLLKHEADLALRLVRPEAQGLLMRRVGRIRYHLYLRPDRLETIRAGGRVPLIGWDRGFQGLALARWMAEALGHMPVGMKSDSIEVQRAAAAAGLGIAVLPDYMCGPGSGLVPLPEAPVPPDRPVWLVARPDMARMPAVRAVMEVVARAARRALSERPDFAAPSPDAINEPDRDLPASSS
ncbi:LysR family transcriptional regulator [Tistrella bauzanensis]|uniref:LysR family transcriptional regulator n=2 Tax=Tistrella arctica TaxID=3133430 RepID=A0ABU9YDR9_9PROT